ncbi:hypothetical protein BDY24DRAFT_362378 [Mrakia frigida]|uniref:peptide-N4-(N-acetyl-beta- glucosaminyl)asparagine amidase n=1 Tax=Mrakia frigida TaxID=29902 RepID=UPI003FCC1344
MDRYEDEGLKALALSQIPFEAISSAARHSSSTSSIGRWGCYEDHLALNLVRWFKSSYMKWVDPILCSRCGGGTESQGGVEPTREEREEGGAGRCEIWRCKTEECRAVERFPRFNDLATLMRTRRGRCGEFSNLFTLFLRAVGLRARYVWNAEDHVWNEYFSPSLNRFIHVDPSEGKTNQPLLYSVGWGKRMTYVFSYSTTGARDTTLSYVLSSSLPKGRTSIGERDLKRAFREVTERRWRGRSEEEKRRLREELEVEERWEADLEGRRKEEREREGGGEGLEGRVSGTREWRRERGEVGEGKEAVGEAVVIPSTPPIFDLTSTSSLLHFGSSALTTSSPPTLLLTTASQDSTSASYLPRPISTSTSFLAELSFKITRNPNSDGADGMAFIYSLEGAPRLGEGGGGMGYGGLGKGWVVEVDTYRTEDRTADPPTPHISLHSPLHPHHSNSLACTPSPASLPPLTDGRWYSLRVQFLARTRRVGVWLADDEQSESEEGETKWEWLFGANVPEEKLSGEGKEAWLGVSAACGGLTERHEIGSWKVWEIEEGKEEEETKVGTDASM